MDGILGLGEFLVDFGRKDGAEVCPLSPFGTKALLLRLGNGPAKRSVAVSRLSRQALLIGLEIRYAI